MSALEALDEPYGARRVCPLCNVWQLEAAFSKCELFPVESCCGDCAEELLSDDEDPRDMPCCTSVCSICTGERGML